MRRTFVTVFAFVTVFLLLDVAVDPSLPLPGSGRLKEMGTTDDRKVCFETLYMELRDFQGFGQHCRAKTNAPKKPKKQDFRHCMQRVKMRVLCN